MAMDTTNYNEILRQTIQDCMKCLTRMTRVKSQNDCPNCCIECVQICEITTNELIQESKFAPKYMELCADICDWTASQCREHPYAESQACAISCENCSAVMREAISEDTVTEIEIFSETRRIYPEITSWFG